MTPATTAVSVRNSAPLQAGCAMSVESRTNQICGAPRYEQPVQNTRPRTRFRDSFYSNVGSSNGWTQCPLTDNTSTVVGLRAGDWLDEGKDSEGKDGNDEGIVNIIQHVVEVKTIHTSPQSFLRPPNTSPSELSNNDFARSARCIFALRLVFYEWNVLCR